MLSEQNMRERLERPLALGQASALETSHEAKIDPDVDSLLRSDMELKASGRPSPSPAPGSQAGPVSLTMALI